MSENPENLKKSVKEYKGFTKKEAVKEYKGITSEV